MRFRNGLDWFLHPEDTALVLIDHQPHQFANPNSHEQQLLDTPIPSHAPR